MEPKLLQEKLPRHVAIIMDGNGRWAEMRSMERIFGHQKGSEAVRTVVRAAREIGIPYLTLFAFSSENWNRPATEVEALMQLLKQYLQSERAELLEKDIRLLAIGDLSRLPTEVQRALQETIEQTSPGKAMTLTLALSYGGRDDILQASRRILQACQKGDLSLEAIDERLFSKYLWTGEIPEPDLLIRTSGEMRISNFFLWQIAYTEIYVTPTLWPDFGREEFTEALIDYQRRERRYGRTREQIKAGER
jgi:undecaprenyl diphosphate synthase